MAVFGTDVEFEVIGVKKFNPVFSALRKRHAVPHLLAGTVCARIVLARQRESRVGPAWRKTWVINPKFDPILLTPALSGPRNSNQQAVSGSIQRLVRSRCLHTAPAQRHRMRTPFRSG